MTTERACFEYVASEEPVEGEVQLWQVQSGVLRRVGTIKGLHAPEDVSRIHDLCVRAYDAGFSMGKAVGRKIAVEPMEVPNGV